MGFFSGFNLNLEILSLQKPFDRPFHIVTLSCKHFKIFSKRASRLKPNNQLHDLLRVINLDKLPKMVCEEDGPGKMVA